MIEEDDDPIIQAALSFSEAGQMPVSTPLQVQHTAKVPYRAAALLMAWKASKEGLYLEGKVPWGRLPKFVEGYLRLLWDTNEYWALRAILVGDVSFFISWLFKLDQIDLAMIEAGLGLADRAALIRFRAAVDGYREVAEKRLKRLGGTWPPTDQSGP
jgi:hypothetical protein